MPIKELPMPVTLLLFKNFYHQIDAVTTSNCKCNEYLMKQKQLSVNLDPSGSLLGSKSLYQTLEQPFVKCMSLLVDLPRLHHYPHNRKHLYDGLYLLLLSALVKVLIRNPGFLLVPGWVTSQICCRARFCSRRDWKEMYFQIRRAEQQLTWLRIVILVFL